MRPPALALLAALLAAGCNDYRFTPAAHCLVQPGRVRVKLSDVSATDLLFVVDDSPSMDPKQAGLAASFHDFISRMVGIQADRVARGLEPLDLRIAVTTSSIFAANPTAQACVSGTSGTTCCATGACTAAPGCTPGTGTGCGAGQACVLRQELDPTFSAVVGAATECCATSACAPAPSGCVPGDPCPSLQTAFPSPLPSSCTPGLAKAGAPYPAGAFVAAPGNPVVLEFARSLDWASWNGAAPDPALLTLVDQFTQNVRVGSCGSGEEQHLEAARLALQQAVDGKQPGVPAGTFPRPDAKLVVVWVGDEDDCSSPASAPVVTVGWQPGADSCVWDKHLPAGQQREFPVGDYAAFLDDLVRGGRAAGFGAGFIVSSVRCADGSYAPADVCGFGASCPVAPPASCRAAAPVCGGAYAAGERFLALAGALAGKGFGVVEGTVCDAYPPASFGATLTAIADLARPPDALNLPTTPAAAALTDVRVVDAGGRTRRSCSEGGDWCFVSCEPAAAACLPAGATSRCIAIDHAKGTCEANPGETYEAEYVGTLPESGCASADDCQRVLGGATADWACTVAPGQARGSCTCTG